MHRSLEAGRRGWGPGRLTGFEGVVEEPELAESRTENGERAVWNLKRGHGGKRKMQLFEIFVI
jgi:hypothetical protein